jgi:hypothetical protein
MCNRASRKEKVQLLAHLENKQDGYSKVNGLRVQKAPVVVGFRQPIAFSPTPVLLLTCFRRRCRTRRWRRRRRPSRSRPAST